jgi:hypothetical protein
MASFWKFCPSVNREWVVLDRMCAHLDVLFLFRVHPHLRQILRGVQALAGIHILGIGLDGSLALVHAGLVGGDRQVGRVGERHVTSSRKGGREGAAGGVNEMRVVVGVDEVRETRKRLSSSWTLRQPGLALISVSQSRLPILFGFLPHQGCCVPALHFRPSSVILVCRYWKCPVARHGTLPDQFGHQCVSPCSHKHATAPTNAPNQTRARLLLRKQ